MDHLYQDPKQYNLVIIEGNIAAGKSTLARELGEELGPNTLVEIEPADEAEGAVNPYLDDFYAAMEAHKRDPTPITLAAYQAESYRMQVWLLVERYKRQLRCQIHCMRGIGHALLDRSYYIDTLFAHNLHEAGFITDRDFATYRTLYYQMSAHVLHPDMCLWLLCAPETAAERIQRRAAEREGRECEKTVDIEYLRALDEGMKRTMEVLQRDCGTEIHRVQWGADRDNPKARAETIEDLARIVNDHKPRQRFFDYHKRLA